MMFHKVMGYLLSVVVIVAIWPEYLWSLGMGLLLVLVVHQLRNKGD